MDEESKSFFPSRDYFNQCIFSLLVLPYLVSLSYFSPHLPLPVFPFLSPSPSPSLSPPQDDSGVRGSHLPPACGDKRGHTLAKFALQCHGGLKQCHQYLNQSASQGTKEREGKGRERERERERE